MQYKKLAEVYEALSSTTKRLEKIEILSKFLIAMSAGDRDVLYLLLGRIYPEYDEKKIGISEQLAVKAISMATGTEKDKVVKEWKALGDLGLVAEKLTKGKRQATLHSHVITTEKVIENLRKLPALEGKGTVNKKIALIVELLTSASPIEAKYLVRTLIGDLRIGLKEATLRDSMALAFFNSEKKEASQSLQKAIDKSNDIASVFEIAVKGKTKALDKLQLEIGKPVKAMLAQKAENIKDGFEKLGTPCAIEYKYDGFRLIIHKEEKNVILFTRRLENVTKQFPEVVEYILNYVKGNNFILDTEAVGFNSKTHEYQPFQNISQRIKRKYDIEKLQKELPVEVNVFDILYYNGKSMLDEPFEKRTELIKKIIEKHPYKIIPSRQIITSDEKEAEKFYKQALKDRQEGVIMKSLQAVYQPGSRVGHMLKMKPAEKDFDLVITGAEYGRGKRQGWMSSFILSCRDHKKNEFFEVGKMSTGIKEKEQETSTEDKNSEAISYDHITKLLTPLITKESGRTVEVKPKIIVAVTYQEIQRSPNYKSGFALRFPRFTALRHDKHISEIASLEEIEKAFEKQKRNWQYG